MKKHLYFAENCIFVFCLLALGLYALVFAPREARVSERENRMLSAFPELNAQSAADGSFAEGFESWLSDSFPEREGMIGLSEGMMGLFGRADADAEARKSFESELGLADDAPPPSAVQAPGAAAGGQDGAAGAGQSDAAAPPDASMRYVRADGRRVTIEEYSSDSVASLARVLNLYRSALGEDGRVFFINVPAADVVNEIYERRAYADWEYDLDEAIEPLLAPGVTVWDESEILEPWKGSEPLYSVGDLHWYIKTAWRVSNAFVAELGYCPTDYYDYEYLLRYSLDRGAYTPEQLETMQRDREDLMVPLTLAPTETSLISRLTERSPSDVYDFTHHGYTMYLGGAKGPYRLISTGFHTGRNALVISDSYAFSMLYYLFPYYDNILQTDLRSTNYDYAEVGAGIREYMELYDIDDVYMISCHWTSVNGPVFSWRLESFFDSAPSDAAGQRDDG